MTGATRVLIAFLALLVALPATNGPVLGQTSEECYRRLPDTPISVSFREVEVPTVLRFVADEFRLNMVVTGDVTGRVTLTLRDVPARDVVRVVVETNNLHCVVLASTFRVSTVPVLTAEQQRLQAEQARVLREESDRRLREEEARRRAIREEQEVRVREREIAELQARGPVIEDTFKLSYADAEDVANVLSGLLGLTVGVTQPLPQIYQPQPPVNIPSGTVVPPAGALAQPGAPATLPPGTTIGTPSLTSPDVFAKGLTIRAHKPTNSIFIRYYANDIARLRQLVKEKLDIPLPQVSIASQMVITTQTALEQLGIQWGGTIVDQRRSGKTPTLLGTGVNPPNPGGGIGLGPGEFVPQNPNLTLNQVLPVSPATGLPLGGNIVNLPTSLLPTVAAPAAGLLFGIVGSQFNLNLAIQALEQQGKARSLSEPRVVTVENSTALISRGFEVPFSSQSGLAGTQVQFKDALLSLRVTPSVIRDKGITGIRMKVVVENNEPDFTRAVLGNPPIFKRRAETEVVVREGERLVIGGVMVETDNKTVRGVPLFGNIPVLGWLFKSREDSSDRQELIVIITPTVVPALTSARK
jgi:type IV pilus assembly protein PilQ